DLIFVAIQQFLGFVGAAHAGAPGLDDVVVRQMKIDIGLTALVLDQPVLAFQAVPQWRLRQRLQQVDGQKRNLRSLDELEQMLSGFRLVGVQCENDSRNNLHAVIVDRTDRFHDRYHHVVILMHGLQRHGIRRLDAAEDRREECFAHPGQNFRALGDIERRLAGEAQDITHLLLPSHQVRQQFERGLAIADEIVVDEIDRTADATCEQLVEFGGDLLRRLQARIAAIESGDIAEFALIGTSARILDAAEEIALELGKLVGRNRQTGTLETLDGLEDPLPLRAGRIARQMRDQLVRRITQFADMNIVERRIVVGTGADRRATDRYRQIMCMRAATYVVHLLALDVHAADQHRLRPFEVLRGGGANVFVDETDRPVFRQICRDQKQALRRHEGLYAVSQWIG